MGVRLSYSCGRVFENTGEGECFMDATSLIMKTKQQREGFFCGGKKIYSAPLPSERNCCSVMAGEGGGRGGGGGKGDFAIQVSM